MKNMNLFRHLLFFQILFMGAIGQTSGQTGCGLWEDFENRNNTPSTLADCSQVIITGMPQGTANDIGISNGTPRLVAGCNSSQGLLIGIDQDPCSEGFFFNFNLDDESEYTISFQAYFLANNAQNLATYALNFVAATGLTDTPTNVNSPLCDNINGNSCAGTPPNNIAQQQIASVPYTTFGPNCVSVTLNAFTPSTDFSQLWIYPSNVCGENSNVGLVIDNICIQETCNFNPYFPDPTFCRVGNQLEISVEASTASPFHGWYVYIKDEGALCEPDNLDNATLIYSEITSNNTLSFTLPPPYTYEDIAGRCIVIKHGTWSENCPWWEFRRAIVIPDIPSVDPNFDIESETDPVGQTLWTFTANPNNIPVGHNWTIDYGSSSSGPWFPVDPALYSDPTQPIVTATLANTRFYRVCHHVYSEDKEICSSHSRCIIIEPLGKEGEFLIHDTDHGMGNQKEKVAIKMTQQNKDDDNLGNTKPLDSQYKILLFPNPANHTFNLSSNYPEDMLIELYNANGQYASSLNVIAAKSINSFSTINLKNGVYVLKIKNKNSGKLVSIERLAIVK